jgi:hypothetical protein
MSRRFPDEMRCPDCGLLVMGNLRTRRLRPHRQRAIRAGRSDAACARQGHGPGRGGTHPDVIIVDEVQVWP